MLPIGVLQDAASLEEGMKDMKKHVRRCVALLLGLLLLCSVGFAENKSILTPQEGSDAWIRSVAVVGDTLYVLRGEDNAFSKRELRPMCTSSGLYSPMRRKVIP